MQRCWDEEPTKRPSFNEILFRIDEILVDAQLHDPQARTFWKQNFLVPKQVLELAVSWQDFRSILEKNSGISSQKWDLVKILFGSLFFVDDEIVDHGMFSNPSGNTSYSNSVSIEWFDRLVHSFGRFFSKSEASRVHEFMIQFVKQPYWFHGEIPRYPAAEDRLRNRDVGTFLIRSRNPFQ